MARCWIIPAESGWGPVQALKTTLRGLGYVIDELRAADSVLLRVSGVVLDRGEVLRLPGEG